MNLSRESAGGLLPLPSPDSPGSRTNGRRWRDSRRGRLWCLAILFAAALYGVYQGASLSWFLGDEDEDEDEQAAGWRADLRRPWQPDGGAFPPPRSCATAASLASEFGLHFMRRSAVHEGTAHRLLSHLERARQGEPLGVAVLGGSVSRGHGATRDAEGKLVKSRHGAIPENQQWHAFAARYLESLVAAPGASPDGAFNASADPAARLRVTVGAKPAVGSEYFSWCFPAHIPADSDVVFVELAVNDEYGVPAAEHLEVLLRDLLRLPHEPAVVLVASWGLKDVQGAFKAAQGGDAHAAVAAYYDVPMISIRDALNPHFLNHPELYETYFAGDERHIAAPLHRALGSAVSHFLAARLCQLDAGADPVGDPADPAGGPAQAALWPSRDELGAVPRLPLLQAARSLGGAEDADEEPLQPTCQVAGPGPRALRPISSEGWEYYAWKGEKFYWLTHMAGNTITFRVTSSSRADPPRGVIALSYLRSAKYHLGDALCWVDRDEERGVRLQGTWGKGASVAQTGIVATGVTPGAHDVTCRSERGAGGGENFHLVAVMSR